jgi:starch synthase
MKKNNKVMMFGAECKPFAKVGGIGDVIAELSPELLSMGIPVEIVMPFHGCVNESLLKDSSPSYGLVFKHDGNREYVSVYKSEVEGVPVHLVSSPKYFEGNNSAVFSNSEVPFFNDISKNAFFSRACFEIVKRENPAVAHVHDWHVAKLFYHLDSAKMPQRRIFTVHNAGYQGNIWGGHIKGTDLEKIANDKVYGPLFSDPRAEWNNVNLLKLGMMLADRVNTVSETYCRETMQKPDSSAFFQGGAGLEEIFSALASEGKYIGITNGYKRQSDPTESGFRETLQEKKTKREKLDDYILKKSGKDFRGRFLMGFVGRLSEQKVNVLTAVKDGKTVLSHMLDMPDVAYVFLGTGEKKYEEMIKNSFDGRDNAFCNISFDSDLADTIQYGSDIFIAPSEYEPCGLTQFQSMIRATPPLVRATGGLDETVTNYDMEKGNGFKFGGKTQPEITDNMILATIAAKDICRGNTEMFRDLQRNAYFAVPGWSDPAKRYIDEMYFPK